MKKRNWKKIAEAIAKKENWILWIETSIRFAEGVSGPIYGYQTSFKIQKDPECCPHCNGIISNSLDSSKYLYVSMPRNIYYWDEDETKAWKGLVEDYLKAMKMSYEELEMQLEIAGIY